MPESILRSFPHATLLNKRLQHRCLPVNFAKFQEHLFLTATSVPPLTNACLTKQPV